MVPRFRPARTALRAGVGLAVCAAVLAPATAVADTPPAYGPGGTATVFRGDAFDTCDAPSLAALGDWWRSSSFRALGIYLSGRSRGCARQPQLTASYVSTASRRGWRLIAIHVGRQAPCGSQRYRISPTHAYAQGREEADEAVAAASRLGLLSGSAIHYDMEGYAGWVRCRLAVLDLLDGWTDRLHARGFLSGVYSGSSSGIAHLAGAYTGSRHSRVDAIWSAVWDGRASVWADPHAPDSYWRSHQRMRQYRGDHLENHGGTGILIDSDVADTIVASVPYRYSATAHAGLVVRAGPSTTSAPVGEIGYGARWGSAARLGAAGPRGPSSETGSPPADGCPTATSARRGSGASATRCRGATRRTR